MKYIKEKQFRLVDRDVEKVDEEGIALKKGNVVLLGNTVGDTLVYAMDMSTGEYGTIPKECYTDEQIPGRKLWLLCLEPPSDLKALRSYLKTITDFTVGPPCFVPDHIINAHYPAAGVRDFE